MKEMARKQAAQTIQGPAKTAANKPENFSPVDQTGPFQITQKDADRGSWGWSRAKTTASDIYLSQSKDDIYTSFYCGCKISPRGSSGGDVDLNSCGYQPRKSVNRARRLEWEHVVPASKIAQGRSCWTQGAAQCVSSSGKAFKGRECCEIADPIYNMAATDPINLVPSIGEVNGDRSNYAYGMIAGEERSYGACDMEISSRLRLAEPPENRRGDVARIWAYMSRAYGIEVTPEQADLYRGWIASDPVSADETNINNAVRAAGFRGNPFANDPAQNIPQQQ
jgi:deoxyribonuclease-1